MEVQMSDLLYSTTDFYTTAVLISKKFLVKSVTVEGTNRKVKRFHFDDTPELRQVILEYTNRVLEGNLREFRDAIETVKDLVHSS
jgi:hypothetical protein